MTVLTASLRATIESDLRTARSQLLDARHRLSEKDSPSNRASVAGCRALIDDLLDRLLDAGG